MATPPDVNALLNSQQGQDLWRFNTQLGAGRVNTQNPYGGQAWAIDPNTGQWTLNQSFSPEQQALYGQNTALAGQGLNAASGFFSDPRNLSRIEYQGPSYTYDGGSRDRAEEALYSRGARYLDPQMQEQERALQDRLTAMGFNVNDPGARLQTDEFRKSRERAYGDLRDWSIAQGGEEATGELQRALSAEGARTGFLRNERSDMTALYNNLRAGAQPQQPWSPAQAQYGTPGMPGMDMYGPALANWNAQQASSGNNAAGWWGLGNNFLNSGAGQKVIGGIGDWIGGFF